MADNFWGKLGFESMGVAVNCWRKLRFESKGMWQLIFGVNYVLKVKECGR